MRGTDVSDPTQDRTPENPTNPPDVPPQAQPPYTPPAPPVAPAYGAPTPPQPPYGSPAAPPYGAPAPQYGAPAPQYGTPAPQYGAGAPQYAAAPGYGYPATPKTNTLAVVSLISSLVGVFLIPFIGQIVGIITGHLSLSQIKTTGEGGRGLALAGLIIGYVGIGLAVLAVVGFALFFGLVAATHGSGYSYSS